MLQAVDQPRPHWIGQATPPLHVRKSRGLWWVVLIQRWARVKSLRVRPGLSRSGCNAADGRPAPATLDWAGHPAGDSEYLNPGHTFLTLPPRRSTTTWRYRPIASRHSAGVSEYLNPGHTFLTVPPRRPKLSLPPGRGGQTVRRAASMWAIQVYGSLSRKISSPLAVQIVRNFAIPQSLDVDELRKTALRLTCQ